MKKIIITIAAVIIVSICFGFGFYLSDKHRNQYMDKINQLQGSSATFAYGAKTLEELVNHADLIVEGKVIEYQPMKEENLIITLENVEIHKVLKGDVSKGDQITVAITGGELDGMTTAPIENCPVMDRRAPYMLYLVKNDAGSYAVIGGNQGFGKIKDNKIEYTAKDKLTEDLRKYDEKALTSKIENIVGGKAESIVY